MPEERASRAERAAWIACAGIGPGWGLFASLFPDLGLPWREPVGALSASAGGMLFYLMVLAPLRRSPPGFRTGIDFVLLGLPVLALAGTYAGAGVVPVGIAAAYVAVVGVGFALLARRVPSSVRIALGWLFLLALPMLLTAFRSFLRDRSADLAGIDRIREALTPFSGLDGVLAGRGIGWLFPVLVLAAGLAAAVVRVRPAAVAALVLLVPALASAGEVPVPPAYRPGHPVPVPIPPGAERIWYETEDGRFVVEQAGGVWFPAVVPSAPWGGRLVAGEPVDPVPVPAAASERRWLIGFVGLPVPSEGERSRWGDAYRVPERFLDAPAWAWDGWDALVVGGEGRTVAQTERLASWIRAGGTLVWSGAVPRGASLGLPPGQPEAWNRYVESVDEPFPWDREVGLGRLVLDPASNPPAGWDRPALRQGLAAVPRVFRLRGAERRMREDLVRAFPPPSWPEGLRRGWLIGLLLWLAAGGGMPVGSLGGRPALAGVALLALVAVPLSASTSATSEPDRHRVVWVARGWDPARVWEGTVAGGMRPGSFDVEGEPILRPAVEGKGTVRMDRSGGRLRVEVVPAAGGERFFFERLAEPPRPEGMPVEIRPRGTFGSEEGWIVVNRSDRTLPAVGLIRKDRSGESWAVFESGVLPLATPMLSRDGMVPLRSAWPEGIVPRVRVWCGRAADLLDPGGVLFLAIDGTDLWAIDPPLLD